ncbi:pyridoxamine 5'-phosphate oxidase family protein [Thalassobaculum sp. OXR-137]|uniref:pyridoxamine 5'-phosphate oxidase family protein n=1 Tax=Thalassobaculum sp. OXR-137 TaxID=3100173 RepID=UPI002AC97C05|nr:pyridoxamine 5'-phosphate oxidase family protein [Thalassobaculum sp. OXR-137]WPZ33523.1 pyridoxamine 5'-phosphate oxidase family protein [Thalassobaculum sp. OXR-137]
MSTPETNRTPFHAGELAMQDRAGVRERIAAVGSQNIRRFLPDQHRTFFADLDLLFVGSVDSDGRPWATVLVGEPGFIGSPTRTRLTVGLLPEADDPAFAGMQAGAPLGLLGLMPQNRRRNRANGRIAAIGKNGFTLDVLESFGNCPQYIHTRSREPAAIVTRPPAELSERIGDKVRDRIERADTFFIATNAPEGVDVSHRGGRAGFVTVAEDGALLWPDFSGNNYFNTLGNLAVDPRAGLLFADFESGDLLQLTGTAETLWDGPELAAFRGAERLVRFRPTAVVLRRRVLPVRFAPLEASPVLADTGTWEEAERTRAALAERDTWRPFTVARIDAESDSIRSIYLTPADGDGIAPHRAGQYLPIRLALPGTDKPLLRTYTISDAAQPGHLRISVKREAGGAASGFLHASLQPGDTVEAMAPRGDFVLDAASRRPVVLLSAGVGITPMIAMLNELVREGIRRRAPREVYFIHGARDGSEQAFGPHLRRLALLAPGVNLHIRFSRPRPQDVLGADYASVGRVDLELLQGLLPFGDYDFYLCGPGGFVADLHAGLRGLNVAADRIHYEFFGPSTLPSAAPAAVAAERAPVTFAASGKTAEWTPEAGSLLDLAEASGVPVDFSCRSGRCGTCAVKLLSGDVGYAETPEAAVPDGYALTCQAHPVGPVSLGV